MNLVKKIFLALICGGYFFSISFFQVGAFLGEDLGLELYKNIDEGFAKLEAKQYEYELTGQGEAPISEVIGPILASQGLKCDFNSSDDMEKALGNSGAETTAFIVEKCNGGNDVTPALLVEKVQGSISYIKNSYLVRSQEKTEKTYEIARIGLYSDGNIENSPFDLIFDLQEIDRIIFSEELEYNGVESDKSADEALDDFLEEDKSYLYENEEEAEDEDGNPIDGNSNTGSIDTIPVILSSIIDSHKYMCPINDSGLNDDTLNDILGGIEGTGSGYTRNPNVWVYPDGDYGNGASWGGPFPGIGGEGSYSRVTDEWGCDPGDFFCIIIEFEKSTYGLAGGNTMAIDKILSKVSEHLEKPANASLTQRKMTTNNFELGSIIKDLPGMLRGFGIDVQTKPIPILDLETGNEDILPSAEEIVKAKICVYFKNAGLDCERQNDLGSFASAENEQKILQTSAGMPTNYVERRSNELQAYQASLLENNRRVSKSVDEEILSDDMQKFGDQFAELEKFVASIEDFCESIAGLVTEMKKIPTRSS